MKIEKEHHKTENKEVRSFALVVSAGFIVIFGLFVPWMRGAILPWWPWFFGLVLIVWSFILPQFLIPVSHSWTKLGEILHRIVNPLILGLIFFGLFVPLGFLKRHISGDALRRELDEETESFRVKSENPPSQQIEKPF